jgi:hypothetical protein
MKSTKMSDEVWYFEDVIDNADELLQSIKDWEQNTNKEYMQNAHMSTKDYLDFTDDAIFKCLDVWYKNHESIDPDDHKVAKQIMIFKRGPGGGYGPHSDFAALPDGTFDQASATVLTYLCDENGFEGGEIFFPDYNVTIKPAKGSVVMFGHKVLHGVNDVVSGERAIASVFLVKNKTFYKQMEAVDPKNPTPDEQKLFLSIAPQYTAKDGNINKNKFIKDEDLND